MLDGKPILSIETSQSLCSTCVYFSEEKFFEINFKLKNAHAEKIFEAIDFVLGSAKIKINDIGAIAVSAGPGSFTGLRIGMSAAKGIAFASSVPLIPVPTFESFAFQICTYLPESAKFIIANRVNVEEIYYAKFQKKSSAYIFIDALQVLKHKQIKDIPEDILIFGNALLDSGNNLLQKSQQKNISSPNAKYIAEWSIKFGQDKLTNNYDYIEPSYIKNFIVKEKKNV
jgi:tRNA threonylcarbamoyladenosine biosynthesis protein TsaB